MPSGGGWAKGAPQDMIGFGFNIGMMSWATRPSFKTYRIPRLLKQGALHGQGDLAVIKVTIKVFLNQRFYLKGED